jgi:hypothetical protein
MTVELRLRNPRGVIEPPPTFPLAPRLKDLAGKRIALIHNTKPGAKTFLYAVEEELKKRYPTTTFLCQYTTDPNLAKEPDFYDEVARSCDAFVFGSGD